eukprot:3537697-Lingulodinium_polyedra.AAC.1
MRRSCSESHTETHSDSPSSSCGCCSASRTASRSLETRPVKASGGGGEPGGPKAWPSSQSTASLAA